MWKITDHQCGAFSDFGVHRVVCARSVCSSVFGGCAGGGLDVLHLKMCVENLGNALGSWRLVDRLCGRVCTVRQCAELAGYGTHSRGTDHLWRDV